MSQKETIAEDLIHNHTQDEIDEYVRGVYEETKENNYRCVNDTVAEYVFADGSKLYWSDYSEKWYAREEQAP